MKVVAKPIDAIVVFKSKGHPLPYKFRYTEENPYISPGVSRETKEGVEYVGFRADVAEFNDLYMKDFHYGPNCVNKMGLGINKICAA